MDVSLLNLFFIEGKRHNIDKAHGEVGGHVRHFEKEHDGQYIDFVTIVPCNVFNWSYQVSDSHQCFHLQLPGQ